MPETTTMMMPHARAAEEAEGRRAEVEDAGSPSTWPDWTNADRWTPAGDDAGKPALLVLCVRVGRAPHVPPGYGTADCTLCGAAVWISPQVVDLAERLGMPVETLCNSCTPEGLADLAL